MTLLERRYRRLLRILPASYRQVWAEEMVAAFLDSMHTGDPDRDEYLAEYGRPSWSEAASVAVLALRLRVGTAAAPPRYLAWGEAIRLVALVGLLVFAVQGVSGTGMQLWLDGRIALLPDPPPEWALPLPADFRQVFLADELAGLVWAAAFGTLLAGHVTAARRLAALAMLPAAVAAVLATVDLWHVNPELASTLWFSLLLDALLLLAMTAFHRDAPAVRPRPWLVAFAVGVALMPAVVLLAQPTHDGALLFDFTAAACLALVVAGTIHLGRSRRTACWTHALATLALVMLVVRVVTLLQHLLLGHDSRPALVLLIGVAEAGAVLAVGVPLAVRTVRALRRLPDSTAAAPAWSSGSHG
jgi:hypothetical protein